MKTLFVVLSVLLLAFCHFAHTEDGELGDDEENLGVYNGEQAVDYFPFHVGLVHIKENGPNGTDTVEYYGSGVIWNEDTVITAASLVDGTQRKLSDLTVLVQRKWANELICFKNRFRIKEIKFAKKTPGSNILDDNIAIIKLERPIDFTKSQKDNKCVSFPTRTDSLDLSNCIAFGWNNLGDHEFGGVQTVVNISMKSQDLCQKEHKGDFSYSPERHLCGTDKHGLTGLCWDDVGGPVLCGVVGNPDQFVFTAIASKVPKGACYGKETKSVAYTQAFAYQQFLIEQGGRPAGNCRV